MDKYLHQDVVVIYEKLTKNPDTEKFALYFMVKLFQKMKNMLVSKIQSQR